MEKYIFLHSITKPLDDSKIEASENGEWHSMVG